MTEGTGKVGLIGLGVMGQGVVLNLIRHGYVTSVYNRSYEKTRQMYARAEGRNIVPCKSLKDLIASLERPRKVFLLVRAGEATDQMIGALLPLLEEGDVIVDLGNAHYRDTERRGKELQKRKIGFLGTGISGGEKGALEGPAIMAGGHEAAWDQVKSILWDIAASGPESGSCCHYFGTGGAGHFIKMTHNGIEYGYMEIIAELFLVVRRYYGLDPGQAAEIFRAFAKDRRVASYLVRITAEILKKKDETGEYLIDLIDDAAGNKGTGRWTSEAALSLGVSVPVLTEALFARYTSTETRAGDWAAASKEQKAKIMPEDVEELRQALELGQYLCFENGMKLIRRAAEENGWSFDFADILKTWENGCIIRTEFSGHMKSAYLKDNDMASLLEDEVISQMLERDLAGAKGILMKALSCNVPVCGLSAAVNYYMAYHCAQLPTAMIQAQRDYFGAHTYRRRDKSGIFHTQWEDEKI